MAGASGRRVPPLVAGHWGRNAPKNGAGPFGRSAAPAGGDVTGRGWGLSPWGINELGWGDERRAPFDIAGGINPARMTRRLAAGMRARRGQFFSVPVPVAAPVVQQDAPDGIKHRRIRRLFGMARRGHVFDVPPVGRAPGQLDAPDRIVGRRVRRLFYIARRGEIFQVLQSWERIPDQLDSRRTDRVNSLARRGRVFSVPPEPVVVVADTPPPGAIRPANRRRTFTLARRGHFFDVPLVHPRIPDQLDSRRKDRVNSLARRGKIFGFPFPVQQKVPDQLDSRRTARVNTLARRGQFTKLPLVGLAPGQFVVPDRIDSQRPRTYTARRGAIRMPWPAIIIAPPGSQALPPDAIRPANRRRTFALARRGRIAYFPRVGLAPAPPIVPDRIGKPRVRQLSVRRSDRWAPIPSYGPPTARVIRRSGGSRSGLITPRRRRYYDVPKLGVVAPVTGAPPTRLGSRRTRGLVLRRGRFLVLPLVGVVVGGIPVNYVIVRAPLSVDIDPAAVRLAIAGLAVSLPDPEVVRLRNGVDALVLVFDENGTAAFKNTPGAQTVIVREY